MKQTQFFLQVVLLAAMAAPMVFMNGPDAKANTAEQCWCYDQPSLNPDGSVNCLGYCTNGASMNNPNQNGANGIAFTVQGCEIFINQWMINNQTNGNTLTQGCQYTNPGM